MKKTHTFHQAWWILWLFLGIFASQAQAQTQIYAPHIAIHVSSGDEQTQNLALNNATNLIKHYGDNKPTIELVAYGPGLKLLTSSSPFAQRVAGLVAQGIKFSACNNTIQAFTKKNGVKPELIEGVDIVPAGVVRLVELQGMGYAYIRP